MIGFAILAAIGAVIWTGMIYVLVVEPVRLYLHERRLKRLVRTRRAGQVSAPAIRGVTVLPRP
jgi:hypothetical protein